MEAPEIFLLVCSLVGALIFIYAIRIELDIINKLKRIKKPNNWLIATILTGFFLIGYVVNIISVLFGLIELQQIFGSLVFALGAIFLVLVISISNKTYSIIFEEIEKEDSPDLVLEK